MIEIRYKNKEEEFAQFSMYRALCSDSYKKAVKRKTYMISGMLAIAGVVYWIISIKMMSNAKNMGIGFGIAFLMGAIVNLFTFKYIVNRSVKKSIINNLQNNKELLGKSFNIKLDSKELKVSRGKERYTVQKEEILEIVNMNECLCIAIKNNAGLVIPYEAFENIEQKEEFENTLRSYISKNK